MKALRLMYPMSNNAVPLGWLTNWHGHLGANSKPKVDDRHWDLKRSGVQLGLQKLALSPRWLQRGLGLAE
jgi:hypothetical protein